MRSILRLAGALLSCSAPALAQPAFVLAEGTRFQTPGYVVDGAEPGPTVLLTGGIHGDEPSGADAADQIRSWPIARGRLIVVPRCNVPALRAGERLTPGVPGQGSDLNRCFPTEPGGAPRGLLATALWDLVVREQPDWVLDLHEGVDFNQVNPKSVGSTILTSRVADCPERAARMLVALNEGIEQKNRKFILKFSQATGSLADSSARVLGIPSMIVETTWKAQPRSRRTRQHRVLVAAFVRGLGMTAAGLDELVHTLTAPGLRRPAIALYDGDGAEPTAVERIHAALQGSGPGGDLAVHRVGAVEIRGALPQFDALVLPPGAALGDDAAAALRAFGEGRVLKDASLPEDPRDEDRLRSAVLEIVRSHAGGEKRDAALRPAARRR